MTTAKVGIEYTFRASATDPDGDTLSWSITNRPSGSSFKTSTGLLTWTPTATGTFSNIIITVTDSKGASTSLPAFSITASSSTTNRAPTISGSPGTSVKVGGSYNFTPSASDPDGDKLTYSITNKPSWASFSTSTGKLSGTPAASHVGTTSGISIKVSDGTNSVSLPSFSLKVEGAGNSAPTISGSPATTATVGVAYKFTPSAKDPDGDAITWSISGKPSDASFSVSTGQLSWTPKSVGKSSSITIKATDSTGKSASLPAFVIDVRSADATSSAVTGTATLSWNAPMEYADGRPLPTTDLVAFRIYRGNSASSLTRIAEVDALTLRLQVNDLAAGTHHFAISAVTSKSGEGALSPVLSKVVR